MDVQQIPVAGSNATEQDQEGTSAVVSACCGDNPQASCCGTTAATCCTGEAAQPIDTACCDRAAVVSSANAQPVEIARAQRDQANDPATLPVAVIGAGPVGLAAAAHLLARGETAIIFEAGSTVGASMLQWGHVRLFSPWQYTVDAAAGSLLEASGWRSPDPETYPTGRDIVEQYLTPLAALPQIRPHLRLHTRVVSVSRKGFDKMKTIGREHAPFLVTVRSADGREERILAKAVIDASGTYRSPNPLGASGVPAVGETALADRIYYGIPAVLGSHRERYAGRRVLVVGSGHSAFNAILDLVTLANEAPGTTVLWAVRRASVGHLFGGGENDLLPARGELGLRVRRLVEGGRLQLVTGFSTTALRASGNGIMVVGEDQVLPPVDEIIATTGFRPDLSFLSEVRLGLDPGVEAPVALAPLIDPNFHSCGTVRPHGVEELSHPEPGFYMVGMKSYGRAPTFLLATGHEQVRSIAAALTGDLEGAARVELELPETGVCNATPALRDTDVSCCTPATPQGVCCPPKVELPADAACCGAPAAAIQPAARADACCAGPAPAKETASACCAVPETATA
jgi:hypothetical protein